MEISKKLLRIFKFSVKIRYLMRLPTFLKNYFWDVKFDHLDFNERQSYIIARLLEQGDARALRWLFAHAHRKKIVKVLLQTRGFSPKTINFFKVLLNLDATKIKCLNKSYQAARKSHWLY